MTGATVHVPNKEERYDQ
uniref:Uncharacterized protein n=1 Tax=Anguilla anguilla TaxID=7936 RepID=A0A0E9TF94_ANGAN